MNDMTTPHTAGGDRDPGEPHEIRALMRELLVDQAVSLDGIFADLTRHAVQLFATSPFASQTFLRIALRAQSGCRFSLESVVRSDRVDAAAAKGAAKGAVKSGAATPAAKAARRARHGAPH